MLIGIWTVLAAFGGFALYHFFAIAGGAVARIVYHNFAQKEYMGKESYIDDSDGKTKKRDKVMYKPSTKSGLWATAPFVAGIVAAIVMLTSMSIAYKQGYCNAAADLYVFTSCGLEVKVMMSIVFAFVGLFGLEVVKGLVGAIGALISGIFTKKGAITLAIGVPLYAMAELIYYIYQLPPGTPKTNQIIDEAGGRVALLLFALVALIMAWRYFAPKGEKKDH